MAYADRVDPANRPPGSRLVSGLAFFHPVVEEATSRPDVPGATDA